MEILKENGNLLGSSSVAAAKNGRTRLTDTNRLPQSSMDGKNKNSFQLDSRDPNNQLPSPMTVGFPAMQPTTSSFVVSILLLGGLRDSSRTLSSEHRQSAKDNTGRMRLPTFGIRVENM